MYTTLFHTALTANDSTAKEQLGAIRAEWDGTQWKWYKYVQVAAGTTVANGTPLAYPTTNTARTIVSGTVADYLRNRPAGVGVGAITASYYGWIQIKGPHSAVITNGDDDIAAGDTIILATTGGQVDSVAAGTPTTYRPLGIATAADVDAANTVATDLCCDF